MSGPLRDRIDLWVTMPQVAPGILVGRAEPEASATVAARVALVRARSERRNGGRLNARLRGRQLRAWCRLDATARRRAEELATSGAASGRGTERLLRVARTIADLDGADRVRVEHLDEAAFYRPVAARTDATLAS